MKSCQLIYKLYHRLPYYNAMSANSSYFDAIQPKGEHTDVNVKYYF